ncbi:MAG: VOC family protein [Proteobacteria bacterium]|nr:VOC family protein [Pseudomonadota bacterium]MCP4915381.1 VOC family protein [Pseudomonadota bacterium]
MIGHASLGVSDLDASGRFYDAILEALGYARVWTHETALGYGLPGGGDKLALFPRDGELAAGPGFHLAFDAPNRQAVDAFHAAALAHGGSSIGEAGPRPHYGETYYAAFVLDPDGHKLETVHQ